MPFTCTICAEESVTICARCTKDTCGNHLCEKCRRCSDCCECEVMLAEPARQMVHPAIRFTNSHLDIGEIGEAGEASLQDPQEEPDPEPDPEPAEPDPLPPAPRDFGSVPTDDGPAGP